MKSTWWEQYWFRPAPYVDLAMVRIFAVAVQLYLLSRWLGSFSSLEQLTALPDEMYNPITALRPFLLLLGVERPDMDLLVVAYYLTAVAGVLALIGLATRTSLLVFALGNIFLVAFVYSFGDFHHTQAPLFIALLVLVFAPSGHALSVDALLRRRRGQPVAAEGPMAGWPIRLIQWMFVLIYLSAVLSKLVFEGGLDWLNGYTLQYYLISGQPEKGHPARQVVLATSHLGPAQSVRRDRFPVDLRAGGDLSPAAMDLRAGGLRFPHRQHPDAECAVPGMDGAIRHLYPVDAVFEMLGARRPGSASPARHLSRPAPAGGRGLTATSVPGARARCHGAAIAG